MDKNEIQEVRELGTGAILYTYKDGKIEARRIPPDELYKRPNGYLTELLEHRK